MTTRSLRPIRARRSFLAVAAGLALVATACGEDSSGSSKRSDTPERTTISILTYDSYVLDPEVQAAVERDLNVNLVLSTGGDGAEVLSSAILTAGRPDADIIFGIDNTLLSRAVQGKLLERLDRRSLRNLDGIPEELRLDDSGRLFPVDVGPVCVDYDTQWFAERQLDPPTSLADLTDPRYRDLLVVASPVTSTPGLVFLMATHSALGAGTEQFWQDLKANGVSVAGSWDDAWNAQYTVNGGDRPLVLSYASSPPAEVFYSEGKVTTPRTGVVTSTCADQVEFAGVLGGSFNVELATKVIDAMLGERWQASLPLANFVYPARTGTPLPELFEKWAQRPTGTIRLDPSTIDKQRDDWIDEWRQIVE